MRVVAEGVETLWQAIAVRAIGLDLVQGYYFARPERGADIPGVIERRPGPDGPRVAKPQRAVELLP